MRWNEPITRGTFTIVMFVVGMMGSAGVAFTTVAFDRASDARRAIRADVVRLDRLEDRIGSVEFFLPVPRARSPEHPAPRQPTLDTLNAVRRAGGLPPLRRLPDTRRPAAPSPQQPRRQSPTPQDPPSGAPQRPPAATPAPDRPSVPPAPSQPPAEAPREPLIDLPIIDVDTPDGPLF